jgi:hypothetical protein
MQAICSIPPAKPYPALEREPPWAISWLIKDDPWQWHDGFTVGGLRATPRPKQKRPRKAGVSMAMHPLGLLRRKQLVELLILPVIVERGDDFFQRPAIGLRVFHCVKLSFRPPPYFWPS